jgi:hypothetical protein
VFLGTAIARDNFNFFLWFLLLLALAMPLSLYIYSEHIHLTLPLYIWSITIATEPGNLIHYLSVSTYPKGPS